MAKTKLVFFIIFSSLMFLTACQSVSEKIDEKTIQEEKELSKWLNKSESELKIVYGQPDKIEFLETRNRNYIYISKKFKIKCFILDNYVHIGSLNEYALNIYL